MIEEKRQELIAAAGIVPGMAFFFPVEKVDPEIPDPDDWGIKYGDVWVCSPHLSKARAELFSASLNNFVLH